MASQSLGRLTEYGVFTVSIFFHGQNDQPGRAADGGTAGIADHRVVQPRLVRLEVAKHEQRIGRILYRAAVEPPLV